MFIKTVSANLNSLRWAIAFLSRLPGGLHSMDSKIIGQAAAWFPVVGLIMATLLTLLASALNSTLQGGSAPAAICAFLVLLLWTWLSGGLHLDGLGDCADAWMSNAPRERLFAIMKDPSSGSGAVIAISLLLLGKWIALHSLLQTQGMHTIALALGLSCVLARIGLLLSIHGMDYASASKPTHANPALGQMLKAQPRSPAYYLPSLCCVLLLLCLNPKLSLFALIAVIAVCLLVRHQAKQKLGGANGDVYGATVELCELAVLLSLATFA